MSKLCKQARKKAKVKTDVDFIQALTELLDVHEEEYIRSVWKGMKETANWLDAVYEIIKPGMYGRSWHKNPLKKME